DPFLNLHGAHMRQPQHSSAWKRWTRRTLVVGEFAGTVSFPLWSGAFSAQEGREGAHEGRQQAQDPVQDQEAMMQAFAAAAKPGEEHALLAKLAGNWRATAIFSLPDGQEMQSTGTSRNEMVMGGRFLQQNF